MYLGASECTASIELTAFSLLFSSSTVLSNDGSMHAASPTPICGGNYQPPCTDGPPCTMDGLVPIRGRCLFPLPGPPPCGNAREPVCTDGPPCNINKPNLVPREGICRNDPNVNPPCGDIDWVCCNAEQQAILNTNDPCSKTPEGICCNGICLSGSCPASPSVFVSVGNTVVG